MLPRPGSCGPLGEVQTSPEPSLPPHFLSSLLQAPGQVRLGVRTARPEKAEIRHSGPRCSLGQTGTRQQSGGSLYLEFCSLSPAIHAKFTDWKGYLMKRLVGSRTLPVDFHIQGLAEHPGVS